MSGSPPLYNICTTTDMRLSEGHYVGQMPTAAY